MGKSNANAIPGDEPIANGYEVTVDWGVAWPRIIARAWREEEKKNSRWLKLLFSDDNKDVKKAFIEAGFLDFDNAEDFDFFWDNTAICVKRQGEEVGIKRKGDKNYTEQKQITEHKKSKDYQPSKMGKDLKNGWVDVKGLRNTVVLTLPPKPENAHDEALAVADYHAAGKIYPFSCCC